MGMGIALIKRVREHVVDEAQQRVEGARRSLEHMFASVGIGSDGSGVSQGILQSLERRPDLELRADAIDDRVGELGRAGMAT